MTYTNTPVITSTTGLWSNANGISFSSINTIPNIPFNAQLEVERIFSSDRDGSTSVITNFLTDLNVKQSDKRELFLVPNSRLTINNQTKTITAINLPSTGNDVYNFVYYKTNAPNTPETIKVPAIVDNSNITIRRKTVSNIPLISWVPGSKLTSSQLNLQTTQLLYLAQELLDRVFVITTTSYSLVFNLANNTVNTLQIIDGAVTPSKISTANTPWSFNGTVSVLAPTADANATTRLYSLNRLFEHGVMTKDDSAPSSSAIDILETAPTAGASGLWFNPKSGQLSAWAGNAWVAVAGTPVTTANLVSTNTVQTLTAAKTFAAGTVVPFTQTGAGAVARTVGAKLNEFISVKDFGAVGDGVADDAAAITAAIATGKAVYLPTGTYKVLTTIVIPTEAMLFGDGKVKTKILAGTIGMTVMASTGIVRNACLRDFTIEPASLSGYGGIGLLVDSFAQCHIENIQINGFRNGSTGVGIKFLNTYGGCYFNNLINLHIENSDTGLLMTGANNTTAVGYMNFSNLVVYQEIDCIVMLCPYENTSIYNYFDIIYIQGDGGAGYGFKCEGSNNSVEVLVIDQGGSQTKNVAFLVGAAGICSGNQIDRTFGVSTYENTNVTGPGNGITTDSVEKTTVTTNFLIGRKDLFGTDAAIMRLLANSATGESKYILGNTTNVQAWSMGCSTADPNWILAKSDNTTAGKFLAVDYVSGTIGLGGTSSTSPATTAGFVGAKNGIYFAQTGVPPTGNGPYLYVDAGALKFKGGSGTVTTIAPA